MGCARTVTGVHAVHGRRDGGRARERTCTLTPGMCTQPAPLDSLDCALRNARGSGDGAGAMWWRIRQTLNGLISGSINMNGAKQDVISGEVCDRVLLSGRRRRGRDGRVPLVQRRGSLQCAGAIDVSAGRTFSPQRSPATVNIERGGMFACRPPPGPARLSLSRETGTE